MFNPASCADQADGLRRLTAPRPVRVIAVTSGKGGVGKTNVSVNLAVSLAALGRNVMLLDADLGLANVDVLLGLRPQWNLSHVLSGERSIEEIVLPGPGGIRVVPAASGVRRMAELSASEHAGIVHAFGTLGFDLDTLIVDTAAGLSDDVTTFVRAAHEVLVVVCDEPASITDAYALIKVLNRDCGLHRFRVLANMVGTPQEGRALFTKIHRATERYLDVALDYLGLIPFDESLRRAVQRQRAVSELFPRSRAALAFKNLARRADSWPVPEGAGGHLEFFVERLIRQEQGQSQRFPGEEVVR